MGRNEKGGYSAKSGRNTRNTEQIHIRVFLEDTAGRTQIPPRPTRPHDEILEGFLCGVHRNGTTAHSTGLPIFVLHAPSCVTKYRAAFCAECIDRAAADAQHAPAFTTNISVAAWLPTSDFLRISAVCAALRDEIQGGFLCGVHRGGNAARSRRCAAARILRQISRLKFVRYAHRQTVGRRHSRAQLHIRSRRTRCVAGASAISHKIVRYNLCKTSFCRISMLVLFAEMRYTFSI